MPPVTAAGPVEEGPERVQMRPGCLSYLPVTTARIQTIVVIKIIDPVSRHFLCCLSFPLVFLFIIAMPRILHKPLTPIILSNYSPYFFFFSLFSYCDQ